MKPNINQLKIDAFKAFDSGVTPTKSCFDDNNHSCLLGAALGGWNTVKSQSPIVLAMQKYNMTEHYVIGLMLGWDELALPPVTDEYGNKLDNSQLVAGYNEGKNIYQEVLKRKALSDAK